MKDVQTRLASAVTVRTKEMFAPIDTEMIRPVQRSMREVQAHVRLMSTVLSWNRPRVPFDRNRWGFLTDEDIRILGPDVVDNL